LKIGKKFVIGTKYTEGPKPPMIPITSAIRESIIKIGRYILLAQFIVELEVYLNLQFFGY